MTMTTITIERLDRLQAIVERAGLNQQTVDLLRVTFRDMHLLYSDAAGIPEVAPVRWGAGFALYLVDARAGCVELTEAVDRATGVLLRTREPEEDDEEPVLGDDAAVG